MATRCPRSHQSAPRPARASVNVYPTIKGEASLTTRGDGDGDCELRYRSVAVRDTQGVHMARAKGELTEGICCPAVSVEPHYLPLWCSSRGCQRTAWSLGRPTPPVGLATKTRGSSHCYGDSMHPKAREGGWESDREGGKRVTKCSNLKTKPAKKQNIPREMLERCDECSLQLGNY